MRLLDFILGNNKTQKLNDLFLFFKGLKQYLCSECPEIFFNKGGFTSHVERKHRKLKKEFKCDICSLTFNEKKAYVMHMSKVKLITFFHNS